MSDELEDSTADSADSELRRFIHAPPVDPGTFLRNTRAARLTPGTVIDGMFVVRERVGQGGMGVVYRAWHEALDRDVAIKLCSRQATERETQRLLREAQATAALAHPNIVVVHHIGLMEGQIYVVMEYVDGGTLHEWLRARPRSWRQIVAKLVEAARGLAAAHDSGFVHRDFKPANVLVGGDERARVSDFGLALSYGQRAGTEHASDSMRSAPEPTARAGSEHSPASMSTLQRAGTPRYMAPEQHTGVFSPATDQFALCVVLYEALCNEHPFEGERSEPGAVRRRNALPRRIAGRVRRALDRGLALDPAERYPSMHVLIDHLTSERRWGPALGLAGVAALGLGGVVMSSSLGAEDPCSQPLLELPTWSPAEREEIRSRFGESSLAAGENLAARVEVELDTYFEAWARAESEVCQGTIDDPKARAGRHACLQSRSAEVDSLLELLAEGDAAVLARSLGAVGKLSSPSACARDELSRLADRAPVDDRELNEHLARSSTALSAHRLDLAMEHADAALAVAVDDYGRARARMQRYRVLDKHKDHAEAAAEGGRALQLAVQAGADDIAAEATQLLVYTAVVGQGQPEAAERWIEQAEGWLARIGSPAQGRVTLDTYRSLVLRDRGDLEGAEALLRETLQRATELDPPRPGIVVTIRVNLASVLQRAGKFTDSETLLYRTLEAIERDLGIDHPVRLSALQMLSGMLFRAGRYEEGIERSREVLAGYEVIYGPQSSRAAAAHINLGSTLFMSGDLEEGRHHNRIALSIYEREGNINAQEVAVRNLSEAAVALGDLDEALELAKRDVVLSQQLNNKPNLVLALVNLASVHSAREEHEEAHSAARRADELAAEAFDPDDPQRAYAWLALGNSAREVGDPEASRKAFERGFALLRSTTGRDDPTWVYFESGLAKTHVRAGRHTEAVELLAGADLSRLAHDAERFDAASVLARARLAVGDRVEAQKDAVRALEYAEVSGDPQAITEGKALVERLGGAARDP